jgi:hypothetical protein
MIALLFGEYSRPLLDLKTRPKVYPYSRFALPPCTNYFGSAQIFAENIIYLSYKTKLPLLGGQLY